MYIFTIREISDIPCRILQMKLKKLTKKKKSIKFSLKIKRIMIRLQNLEEKKKIEFFLLQNLLNEQKCK